MTHRRALKELEITIAEIFRVQSFFVSNTLSSIDKEFRILGENGISDTFDVKCCSFFVGFEPKVASVHSTEIKVQDVAVPGDVLWKYM